MIRKLAINSYVVTLFKEIDLNTTSFNLLFKMPVMMVSKKGTIQNIPLTEREHEATFPDFLSSPFPGMTRPKKSLQVNR
jgi:hypothetical protein